MGSSTRNNPTSLLQQLNQTSVGSQHVLGTCWMTEDGSDYVYSKAGAVALLSGRLVMSPAAIANHGGTGLALSEHVAGDQDITVTLGATAVTANQYANGKLVIVNDSGSIALAGATFTIDGHPAADASATVVVRLKEPLTEPIDANSTGSLILNKQAGCIIAAAPPTAAVVGIPIVDVPAAFYFWAQRRGIVGCLQQGTLVNGQHVVQSDTTAGACAAQTVTVTDEPIIGVAVSDTATADVGVIDLRL